MEQQEPLMYGMLGWLVKDHRKEYMKLAILDDNDKILASQEAIPDKSLDLIKTISGETNDTKALEFLLDQVSPQIQILVSNLRTQQLNQAIQEQKIQADDQVKTELAESFD